MKELNLERSFRPEAFQTSISKIVRTETHKILKNIHGKILDVGCGNGIFLLEAAADYPEQFSTFGVDMDFASLENAKLVFMDNGQNPDRFIQGDAYHLPFADNTFDAVFCKNTLMNITPITTIESLIRELHRVCKKGKYIIFDYRNAYNPAISVIYKMNRLTNSLSVFAYKWKQFKPLVKELNVNLVSLTPLGSKNPFLAKGYLTVLEK
ncbi:class I SAM-dependent methyltransferase [bacterium]|nr:class I SAM-dependent methyltransferase [bacterium]MBU1064728.1 class I SAM-dependent methyltransferase [bacterium]MBU1633905.1 class I SAM-dependent methyltransferase [bacterium]MBU1872464.1 class I SAM-dependent methyltransferase [bacterium]